MVGQGRRIPCSLLAKRALKETCFPLVHGVQEGITSIKEQHHAYRRQSNTNSLHRNMRGSMHSTNQRIHRMKIKHHKSSNTFSVGRVTHLTYKQAVDLLAKYEMAMSQLFAGETLIGY